jgi:DNA-binding protein HU-beta
MPLIRENPCDFVRFPQPSCLGTRREVTYRILGEDDKNQPSTLDAGRAMMQRRRVTDVTAKRCFVRLSISDHEDMMNKNDLIEHIAQEYELTKTFAKDLVENLFEKISDTIHKGDEVSIFGFGKFKLVDRKARKGRNPQTGEAIKIAASKNVKFEQAKGMKERVNAKRRARK